MNCCARTKFPGKYYKQAAGSVGTITAARFLQVENQMLTLLDALIFARIHLVKTGAAGEEKTK